MFLRRFTYRKSEGQYGPYFARFYGPLAFVFAIFSVLLSAMQVILAALPVIMGNSDMSWVPFAKASTGFSIFTLLFVVITLLFLVGVFLSLLFIETIHALKDLYHKKSWDAGYLRAWEEVVSVLAG